MNILMDTGFMVAMLNPLDAYHEQATIVLNSDLHAKTTYHTVWECVAEACHHLNNMKRQALLRWLHQSQVYVHATRSSDLPVIADYMQKYANVSKNKGPDLADVALVLLADQLNTSKILTVDENDFCTYRTLSGRPFQRLWLKQAF